MARSKPKSASSNSRDVSSVGKGIRIPSKRRRTESGEGLLCVEGLETPRMSLVDGNGSPGPRRAASAGPSKALPSRGTTVEDERSDVLARSEDDDDPSRADDDEVSRVDYGRKGKTSMTPRPTKTLINLHQPGSCGSKVLPSEREGRLAPPTRQRSFSTSGEPELQKYKGFLDVRRVHNKIKNRIKAPVPIVTDDNAIPEGDCYVFKQVVKVPEDQQHAASNLLKIGATTNIQGRIDELEGDYKVSLVDAEALVRQGENVLHFKRVEKLVQDELWNFRYYHPSELNARTEWFLIPTEQATKSVQRWRRFMGHKPYDEYGQLKEFWVKRLKVVKYPAGEEVDDHEKRNERWNWFVDKIDEEVPPTDSAESNDPNTRPTTSPKSLEPSLWRTLIDMIHDRRLYCGIQSVLWFLTVIEFSPWLSPLVTCFWIIRSIAAFGGFDPLVLRLFHLRQLFLRKAPEQVSQLPQMVQRKAPEMVEVASGIVRYPPLQPILD